MLMMRQLGARARASRMRPPPQCLASLPRRHMNLMPALREVIKLDSVSPAASPAAAGPRP